MKNGETKPTKKINKPTHPGVKLDMDELAKVWIELVLSHIQKQQSFSLKRVHTINYRTI